MKLRVGVYSSGDGSKMLVRLGHLFGASLTAAFVLACLGAGPASAASYDVWSCRGPIGLPLSTAAWTLQASDAEPGDLIATDDCATGGSITLDMTNGTIPANRKPRLNLLFDLPRGGKIVGYELLRSMRAAGAMGHVYAVATQETTGSATYDQGCASVLALPNFDCGVAGSSTDPFDPGNLVTRPVVNLDGLSAWAGCLTVGCGPSIFSPVAEYKLFRARVTIEDNLDPVVTDVSGTLTDPGPVSGRASIFVDAVDHGGGIASMSLSIDGQPYAHQTMSNSPTCSQPYEVPRPCPSSGGRMFTVDTSGLTAGPHVAGGQVTDAAGNVASFGPIPFQVSHPGPPEPPGPPPPDNGTPAIQDPVIAFERSLFEQPPRRPVLIQGTLRTPSGAPVIGARIDLETTDLGTIDARQRRLQPALTGPDGRFSVTIAQQGARRLTASYSPVLGQAATRTASTLVRTRAALTLKARPRAIRKGRTVRFVGRLNGVGAAARGSNVEIQAVVGGGWRTVGNATVRAGGKFQWRYRFKYVDRNALFSFRATVRRTPGWPWPALSSKRAKVRIKVG